MGIVNLNSDFEPFMEKIREVCTPKKAAAISCILYAQEQAGVAQETVKLQNAIEWIVQEIVDIDPRMGLRVKAHTEILMNVMAGRDQATEDALRKSRAWDEMHEEWNSANRQDDVVDAEIVEQPALPRAE